jgi:PTS system galactitol-specific IIB component
MAVGIEEALKERGVYVQTRQCKTAEISGHLSGVDLIVTTNSVTGDFGGIPVIRSLAFLTGIGKDKLIDDIIAVLKK